MSSGRVIEQPLNNLCTSLYSLFREFRFLEDDFDKQDQKTSGEAVEVLVEKLILAAQSLLSQIADLKRQSLLADFKGLNSHVLSSTATLEAELAEKEKLVENHSHWPTEVSEGCDLHRLYLLAQEVPLPR